MQSKSEKTIKFIEKAIIIHGNKYNYSKVDYVNNQTKVKIICSQHGEFLQLPSNHLRGCNCLMCSQQVNTSNSDLFINKSNFIHKNKYDYSKVNYINSRTEVIITCKEHGDFLQVPNSHLKGNGCYDCGLLSKKNCNLQSIDEFIYKSNIIHKNKYDYSEVEYLGYKIKVKIICPNHGVFLQTPSNHLLGGCKKCSLDFLHQKHKDANNINIKYEKFIQASLLIHENKYLYDKVKYQNNYTPVTITCKIHGDFDQAPYTHANGGNCKKCVSETISNLYKFSTVDFINKSKLLHGDKYIYNEVDYKDNISKVIIICKIHGAFLQNAGSHMGGCGCPKCKGSGGCDKQFLLQKFLTKSKEKHGDKYDYSKVEYVDAKTNVIIICSTHGEFKQTPDSHSSGKGCSKCIKKIKQNLWLDSLSIPDDELHRGVVAVLDGKKYIFDGYDSDTKTIYEFNGDFWHGNPKVYKAEDINSFNKKTFGELYNQTIERENKLINFGYKIISIWECEFDKLNMF